MQADTPEIAAWKKDFDQRLDAFVRERAGEIGDPGRWKVRQISLTAPAGKTAGMCSFLLFDRSTGKMISFTLPPTLKNLPPEKDLALREYVNDACKQRGFIPYKPRITPLSSETMTGVKQGDDEAWTTFVSKHHPKWLKQAENALHHSGVPSIFEPEDVVAHAMLEFIQSKPAARTDHNPEHLIALNIMRTHARHWRPQADGRDFDRLPAPDGHDADLAEALRVKLFDVLEETKKNIPAPNGGREKRSINTQQIRILDIIVDNWREGKAPLRMEDIGGKLKISRQAANVHMGKLVARIQRTAERMARENHDYEPIRYTIESLAHQQQRGHGVRNRE